MIGYLLLSSYRPNTVLSIVESPVIVCDSPDMTDPLTEVISLLQPRPATMKLVYGGGAWRVRRELTDRVFYGLALDGGFRFQADGHAQVVVEAGDFLLVPSAADFTVSS